MRWLCHLHPHLGQLRHKYELPKVTEQLSSGAEIWTWQFNSRVCSLSWYTNCLSNAEQKRHLILFVPKILPFRWTTLAHPPIRPSIHTPFHSANIYWKHLLCAQILPGDNGSKTQNGLYSPRAGRIMEQIENTAINMYNKFLMLNILV